jgi:Protein of unknown function (DUF1697)
MSRSPIAVRDRPRNRGDSVPKAPVTKSWLALLRGINVLGRNKVPMKALASALESAGFQAVRTYIQSGNVLFRSSSEDARALAGLADRPKSPDLDALTRVDAGREAFALKDRVLYLWTPDGSAAWAAETPRRASGCPRTCRAAPPRRCLRRRRSRRSAPPDRPGRARWHGRGSGRSGFATRPCPGQ